MIGSRRTQGPRRKRSILAEIFPDEAILYNPELGTLHLLNVTAAAIWSLCDGQLEVSAIAARRRRQFEMRPEQPVEHDVDRTLAELISLGLVEPA